MQKKQGISLIVLVITIIVMIILAASVVITLNNTGVINRANEAVDKTNEKQVQDLAALVWADKFMEGKRGDTLKEEVLKELEDYTSTYDITVTDTGIEAKKKGSTSGDTEEVEPGVTPTITITPTTITETIAAGSTKTVTITPTLENITETLTWSSNNEAVATVIGNNTAATVTLKGAGTATITATANGVSATCSVTVTIEDVPKAPLGSLVTAADYGKTINYSVTTKEGGTYSNWKVYYEDETNGYVYIVSNIMIYKALGTYENSTYTGYGDASALTTEQLALYKKFKLGQDGYTLNSANANSNAVAYLITGFGDFANKTASYGSYVEGAIGAPTLELMCAGWNAWNEAKKAEDATHTYTALTPSSDASWSGYKINKGTFVSGLTNDGFYIHQSYFYWMASPSANGASRVMTAGLGHVRSSDLNDDNWVRPVVCLNSNIPAVANAEGTGFEI